MYNVASSHYTNKSTFHPFSEKVFPQTPIHKNHEGHTAIKKISNYSYALSDQIGLGLTSKVFKGKNDLNGMPVAVKCMDLKSQKDSLNQEFVKQEIAILQRIKSTQTNHLLKLEAVILTTNNLYIVTQFCEGKDVGKILRQKKTLSEQQAQTIMKQLIWGYRQLYGLGLIHRDLKLSNLLVTNGKIKLADFGFAIGEDKCTMSFTYNVGSPKYMPPETLKFNKYSFKSDAWALGVMAYELVYGHAPWKDKDDAKLFDLISNVPIQSLFDPNVPVSDHYKTFIANCLRPNINQRAGPDFVFNYVWPQAIDFVQGYEQEKKVQQVIKMPGKNYAVYNSSNEISYQSKQIGIDDFTNNPSVPAQFILLSRLNYCRFLINIFKNLKTINKNQLVSALIQEIGLTVQIITKILGETACMQFNRIEAPNFDSYIKTGDWQNLKQVIIRNELQSIPPARKNSVIPQSTILQQTIAYLKTGLPENARLIDKLITYLEIRQILASCTPFEFAERVPMASIMKEVEVPDNMVNLDAVINRVVQRLNLIGL